jgi:hypothetical protein
VGEARRYMEVGEQERRFNYSLLSI